LGARLRPEHGRYADRFPNASIGRSCIRIRHAADHDRMVAACKALLRRAGAPLLRRGSGGSEVPLDLRSLGVTSREMDVLCHQGHNGHGPLERRYLIVPGIRSSRVYVLDTKPDPRNPRVVREISAAELAAKAGYSRPHTVHCGPGGIFLFNLGGTNGNDGPGGVALLDHDSFEVIGPWELDRGEQYFAYDGWWHLDHDTMITSEWGTPPMFEQRLNPEDLLGRRFGHHRNFWSMSERKLTQRIDLGDAHQLMFEVRPAHDPAKAYGFVGVVINVETCPARSSCGTATAAAGRPAR
jgi:56kDa selenium binding protein (SBP56)